MSRSGYSDDCENLGLWRGTVKKAIEGKRGQAFLREMREALDALPSKALTQSSLVEQDGSVCAMGAVALKRSIDVSKVDPYERFEVAEVFGISPAMAAEIAYINDEGQHWNVEQENGEQRWNRVRSWVERKIKPS